MPAAVSHDLGSFSDAIYEFNARVGDLFADKRAEIRGAKGWSFHEGKGGVMQPDVVYYIGWRYKFTLSEITGKGTFYRVRVGPFSGGDAQRLCDDLKSVGGDCVPVMSGA